jgi:hypothetical protein
MPSCLQCHTEFSEPAQRRGSRPRTYCNPKCQQKAANARRSTTRAGRLVIPMTKEDRATIANLFGQWFIRRKAGYLILGPLPQSQAQERADAMNKETMK